MKSHHQWLAVMLLMLSAAIPANARPTDPLGGTGGGPISGSLHVTVVREGSSEPFPGAFVMVGPRAGNPFAGNWGFTSAAGEISFADSAMQGPVTVTAGAPGHQYFTIVAVDANDLVLPLTPVASGAPLYEVGDFVSGIDVDNGTFHSGDGNVDMAMVLPALRLEELLAFDMANLFGPPETITILGESFEVPANFFIPQQWELFIEIIKDHYYLYLGAGDYTLVALAGRIPVEALLGGGAIQDLLPQFQWRETDLLNISVTGNMYTADMNVDPDLTPTVTLDLANIPEGSLAYCLSAGDLDNLGGLGRLIPLGITSLDCPGGSGPCAGSLNLTTTAASGEFAGMAYFPAVVIDYYDTDDMLVLVDRAPRPQSYTADMNSFFDALDLDYVSGGYGWNAVANPGAGSPDVHIHTARIKDSGDDAVYWEFILAGDRLGFEAPLLPAAAPPGPAVGSFYTWEQVAIGLGYDLPAFDFNNFAFTDILDHSSHLALDLLEIIFGDPSADAPEREIMPASVRLGNSPNPFSRQTGIHFDLLRAGDLDLAIYTPDGRRVSTLLAERHAPGSYQAVWDGRDDAGRSLPSGIYHTRLTCGNRVTSRSVVLLR